MLSPVSMASSLRMHFQNAPSTGLRSPGFTKTRPDFHLVEGIAVSFQSV
jgi:hypothetical protein